MAALLQLTEADMNDILGNQGAGEEIVSNISGKAVELIQNKLDMQTFIYMSNMAKGMRRCGEIWLSMAKDIYIEEGRRMKAISPTGTTSSVELMKPMISSETGEITLENDLSSAKFDVNVEVGPSSSSKRSATVRALTGMMQITNDPETASVLQSMAMMNMEGEGISDVREYFRNRLVKMGVIKPTEEEAAQLMAELQGQPEDPNAIFLQAAAEEATAKAAKARADTVKTVADAELSRAKTLETLSNVDMDSQDHALNMLETIGGAVQQQAAPMVTNQGVESPPMQ
jgi:hypothetical protein